MANKKKRKSKYDSMFEGFEASFKGQIAGLTRGNSYMEIDFNKRLFKIMYKSHDTEELFLKDRGIIDRLSKNSVWLHRTVRQRLWRQVNKKGVEQLESLYADALMENILLGIDDD